MNTKFFVRLMLLIIACGLSGCINGRYYRQPLTTSEFTMETETYIDTDGKTKTKITTKEYIKNEPPPQPRYYQGSSNYYSGNRYRGGGRDSIRLCIFGCNGRHRTLHHNR